MTIFLNFYIFIYMITLIQLNYLLINHTFLTESQNSISYLITYILKFNKFKTLVFILFLSLSGLPPFILFFIKVNYLINLLYKLNFFLIFLIFLIFFLNMLFYIQIFFHKNTTISFKLIKPNKNYYINYKQIYIIIWFISFLIFNFFIFSDIFYILKLL